DLAAVGGAPSTPLRAVDRAEIAVLVGPLVPDRHAVPVQIIDVRVAGEKPQKLVDDRAQMQLLRRHEREAFGKIEAHLITEDAERARPGAVALLSAALADRAQQVEILSHRPSSMRRFDRAPSRAR